MKRSLTAVLLILLLVFSFSACAPKGSDPAPPLPPSDVPEQVEPEPEPEPTAPSLLTGLDRAPEEVTVRPIAVMINNLRKALPQVGISQAQVYYECLSEGGITRILALFEDYRDIQRLGWVRSARDYFIDFAESHDAIFCHYGGSPQAYTTLKKREINALDGIYGGVDGITYFRDQERRRNLGAEHSVYATGEGLVQGIEKRKIRAETGPEHTASFAFSPEVIEPQGDSALHLAVRYSNYITGEFAYDEASGLYLRSEFGQRQIDGENDEPIAVTNVLVLYTDISGVPGDTEGRLKVRTTGEGRGLWMSRGHVQEIQWSKAAHDASLELFDLDGHPLLLNRGKSFVCVFSAGKKSAVTITGELSAEGKIDTSAES
jgi:predicted small lipoprotein YifL